MMRRSRSWFVAVAVGLAVALLAAGAQGDTTAGQSRAARHRAKKGSICGNPMVACKTSVTFQPNDLPFRVPAKSVIFDTESFYAIILKRVATREDDCDVFIPETERMQAQALFPDRKVFSSRCADIENLFYTNVNPNTRVMAVYAGTTLEAKKVLQLVRATGKFPGAIMRRMRTGFNGT